MGLGSSSGGAAGTLTHNAVLEHRYNDAGHYLWTLAKELLATAPERPSQDTLKEFDRCRRTAALPPRLGTAAAPHRRTAPPHRTATPQCHAAPPHRSATPHSAGRTPRPR